MLVGIICQKAPSGKRQKTGEGRKKSAGAGNRGGNWNNDAANSCVSNRNNAANPNADRNNNYGFRCARTACRLAEFSGQWSVISGQWRVER